MRSSSAHLPGYPTSFREGVALVLIVFHTAEKCVSRGNFRPEGERIPGSERQPLPSPPPPPESPAQRVSSRACPQGSLPTSPAPQGPPPSHAGAVSAHTAESRSRVRSQRGDTPHPCRVPGPAAFPSCSKF